MLYKNIKYLIGSPDILASLTSKLGFFRVDILAPFLFLNTLDTLLRTSLYKLHHLVFTLSPRLSSQYPAKKLINIDYANDLAITADTITNATVLQHNLQNADNDVVLYVNSTKTEFIGFNQQNIIQTISGESINLSNLWHT